MSEDTITITLSREDAIGFLSGRPIRLNSECGCGECVMERTVLAALEGEK